MLNFSLFEIPILLVTVAANLLLAVFVYRNNRTSATNRIFTGLSILISYWLLIMYLSLHPQPVLSWTRLNLFFAVPMNFTFFLLAHTMPSSRIIMTKRQFIICWLAGVVAMMAAVSPFAFTHLEQVRGNLEVVPGPALAIFIIHTLVFDSLTIFILRNKFKKAFSPEERKQLSLMLVGIFLMLGLLIFTILVPVTFFQNRLFVPLAPLYALIFLATTAVGIVRYHLFNLKVIITEALVVLLVGLLIFEGVTADTLGLIIFKMMVAGLVALLGVFLVRSVKKEIKEREEVANLAASLEKANLRLQELDQQKTDFLSIAAHQLRTPLSVINGYVELIEDGAYGKITQKTKDVLKNMDESNARLTKLVDEFLDITRIEQGRTKFDFVVGDVNKTITSVVDELRTKAEQKGLKISWQPPKDPVIISMDEDKVRHVIFNFIDNAIKYSWVGTITPSAGAENNGVAVRVIDQGFGFEKKDEANFFQKFYRGDNVKGTNVGGTGLGLYVCHKFIEAHQGKIWAHSPGLKKGSEFGLWLPNKFVN